MSTRFTSLISDPRVKQVLVGLGAIFSVCAIIGLIWYGGTLPGFIGEWFAMVLGIITTPFLMEGSFIVLGLLIVLVINYWRLRRDGDELVYLDETKASDRDRATETFTATNDAKGKVATGAKATDHPNP